MKLASRYNRVNSLISLVILIITGLIYYFLIHFILTEKLDKDLAVEENEIHQYVATYNKLPLPANYLDQQIDYTKVSKEIEPRAYSNTQYFNPKEKEFEPGRSLTTSVVVNGEHYIVKITKSRVESEDLVRMIFYITVAVILMLLLTLFLINKLFFNRLWKPFYLTLNRMKSFEVSKMENIAVEPTNIDEFNELNQSVNAMLVKVQQDYKELKSFTDNASHEMMTPLAVINSKLDSFLQTEGLTQQQGLLIGDIYLATGKLSRLNQSLLLLAKIENNLISDVKDIDFKQLLQDKLRQFKELFERNQLDIDIDLQACEIKMSGYLADILLNNLLSNAIRHNVANGQIKITLTSKSLTIGNTGKILQNNRLFERFSKSTDSEGLGLGLAITKQICNLYQFKIQYQEKENWHFFTINF